MGEHQTWDGNKFTPKSLAQSQSYAAIIHCDTFGNFKYSRGRSVRIFRHKRMIERKDMKFPYLTTNRFSSSHSLSLDAHQTGQKEKQLTNLLLESGFVMSLARNTCSALMCRCQWSM